MLLKKLVFENFFKNSFYRIVFIYIDAEFNALSNETNRNTLRCTSAEILTKYW